MSCEGHKDERDWVLPLGTGNLGQPPQGSPLQSGVCELQVTKTQFKVTLTQKEVVGKEVYKFRG